MPDRDVSELGLVAAMRAAGAVTWKSSGPENSISVDAHEGDSLACLSGQWRLEEFLNQFDGLSRRSVRMLCVRSRGSPVLGFSASLASGQSVRFRGLVEADGSGMGLIISEDGGRSINEARTPEAVFQPIFSLRNGNIAGLEVLARFRDAAGNLVSPETEDKDGAVPSLADIGPLMVQAAADALMLNQKHGTSLFVQINLSALELGRPKVVAALVDEIGRVQFAPGQLRVEITEQAALRDVESAKGAIAVLRSTGAGVVLDDFGAGHSSMVWLCELPVDGVKLDAGVIRAIETSRGLTIVQGLLDIMGKLDLEVIAEGLEKQSQVEILRNLGCEFAQGFVLGAPVSLEQIDAQLSAG